MAQTKTDQKILAELREPIGELVDKYCAEKTQYERLRLRQLAWQAVDVLARTGNVANLENEKEIKRIIGDIRKIGASEEFLQDSLALAVSIYRKLEIDHPRLLERYRGES